MIRPTDSSAPDWFVPATVALSVVAVMLIAGGLRPGPKPKLAYVEVRAEVDRRRRRF